MPNLNKVMLMGNLTHDPEMRYLPSIMAGAPAAKFFKAVIEGFEGNIRS